MCNCFNVTDLDIKADLLRREGTPEERLAALQGALRCGSNCGSCIPQLKRLVRETAPPATGAAPLQMRAEPVGAQAGLDSGA